MYTLDEEAVAPFSSLPVTRFGKRGNDLSVQSAQHLSRDELRTRLEHICGGKQADDPARAVVVPTGFAQLDAALPGGGWPVGAITELMPEAQGIGELSLLMPALAQLCRAGRYLAWIAPPCLPYPPALVQHGLALERMLLVQAHDARAVLWATEQVLRCPAIGAVLAWPASLDDRRVRRLQLAAEAGGSCGLLYRPPAAAQQHSPAALRLKLSARDDGLHVDIHKARGRRAHALVVHPAAALCA
ncbi:MAG: translesion DNA synthesis-associated protein ImuA [Proteobacteria bacterium]|nr:translesion DNA synthesis-associated protein ImuA [Pseudomonadota bacterium]